MTRLVHDCEIDRCDNDPRQPEQVWAEGYAAFGNGARYQDCPYGHQHPDVRFNYWIDGWREARFAVGLCRYCNRKRRSTSTTCAECGGGS